MFIFVFLNFLCLVIVLAKCIWHSESSRITTAKAIDRLLNVPKREIDVIIEEQNMFEGDPEHNCSDCYDSGSDSDSDSSEKENSSSDKERLSAKKEDSSDDSAVMVDYVEKSKQLISAIKDELEKKTD
jgi:hypothetical protein